MALEDREITCPHCGETTTIAVSTPDLAGKYEAKGSMTSCRRCREQILTVTQEDGSIVIMDM